MNPVAAVVNQFRALHRVRLPGEWRTPGFFRDLPINKKLLAAYLSIFVVCLLAGSTVLYSLVRSTIEANIEQELNNTTSTMLSMVQTAARVSIKNHLRAVAEQNLEIIASIYEREMDGTLSQSGAKDLARRILQGQTIGKTGYIYCVDSQGVATLHPKQGIQGAGFLKQAFVREQIKRKEGYLEYEWKNPGEAALRPKALYMTYFQPWDWIISVSSYREEFSELINVDDFRDSILSLRFGKTGYSFVLDSSGRVIIHPILKGNAFDYADDPGQEFIRTICEKKKGKLVYSWKNPGETRAREKLVIFNYIPEYDWIVASSCYLAESYAPLARIRNVILATVTATLLLTIPITWLMSVSIVRPMKTLMANFRKGAGGDLSVRMETRSIDEIGQLAGYFNYFMEKLEQSNRNLLEEVRERKQAEAGLRISEEKYRTILERMEEGYYEVSMTGCFTFFNASLESILGYSRDKLSGLDVRDIATPASYRQILDTFRAIELSGRSVKTATCELIRGDGSRCLLETSVSLMLDGDGNPAGYRGVLKDITEKNRAEQALRRSEEMFSKAFRSSPSGMFIATLEHGRVIDVNDSFLKFTGFSPGGIIGSCLPEQGFFVPEGENARILSMVDQGSGIRAMEIGFRSRSGESRLGILSAEVLVLREGRCMLAALEDITDTRRLEREILDISENEQRRIGRTLHDDICPHLLGVEVMSNVLKQRLAEKDLPEAVGADRIQVLIQDSIRKMKRLSQGLYPVDLTGGRFDSAIADLVTRAQEIFGIPCRFVCDLPVSIDDDTAAVHAYYIAHEALHNAVRHAGAGGITVTLSLDGDRPVLTVADDGIGLPTVGTSAGMGMRIMQYRARRIGGGLFFSSGPNGGTAVTLKMKAASMAGPA